MMADTLTRSAATLPEDMHGVEQAPPLGLWAWDQQASCCLHCAPCLLEMLETDAAGVSAMLSAAGEAPARIDPEDRLRYVHFLGDARRTRAARQLIYRIVGPTGTLRIVRDAVAFSGNQQGPIEIRAIEDLTEIDRRDRETEALERHAAAQSDEFTRLARDLDIAKRAADQARLLAEGASRAKSEFLANMSHELRTPLNAVIGFAQMMAAEMFGKLGHERYREYCYDILASGHHLLDVINDLLDLAKIEAGRIELDEEDVDLDDIVSSSLRLIHHRASNKNIQIMVACQAMPRVLGDHRALRQILLNVLSNAVKFTNPGGHITVDGEVDILGRVHIRIADDGIGIPEADVEHVLEPFAQAANSRTTGESGTGLGLSIVKSLVELHGGEVHLSSTLGAGTTVTILLPASRVIRPRAGG